MHITPLQFEVHPSSGTPIYRQIMDQVRALIAGRRLEAGDVLPSVRQMAEDLQVNMMTVSKAYSKLESEGILLRSRGIGMTVATGERPGPIAERREELRPLAEQLVVRASQLALTDEQTLAVVRDVQKEFRNQNAGLR